MVILKQLAHKYTNIRSVIGIILMALLFFSACSPSCQGKVDRLNNRSYAYRYLNLDSTRNIAFQALKIASDGGYEDGEAEALNNLAFVSIAHMRYANATKLLYEASFTTNNQIELLVTDVLNMRLCQRESRNKDFYVYREQALQRLGRIKEELNTLTPYLRKRLSYVCSEFHIVSATYFYYVGQNRNFIQELEDIDPDDIQEDRAQYLSYLYNMGAGGAVTGMSAKAVSQKEFDYLMECYILAGNQYPFWRANALQALSEHLLQPEDRNYLIHNNIQAIRYINVEDMPDTLLAGNLAQRSLNIFERYGDVYQIAGAYRTLASCYGGIGNFRVAILCLENALSRNLAINKAPNLVASIREKLSVAYSAVNDKPNSDRNRNIYLDLQEQTRQDRLLEARADQLNVSTRLLNGMIVAIIFLIFLLIFLLLFFDRMRKRREKTDSIENLLNPLKEWKLRNDRYTKQVNDRIEEIHEKYAEKQIHLIHNKRRNIEQRAKILLVNSIMPFIDRMIHEMNRLQKGQETEELRQSRFSYISELLDHINQDNNILTQWIQLQPGLLSLQIESFPIQSLLDIVTKSEMKFSARGVKLIVPPSDCIVKADRSLTLFMINTISDNALKFTPKGGEIRLEVQEKDRYIEISVTDNGYGMSPEKIKHIFDHKSVRDEVSIGNAVKSHGFGLMNCKGIIEKYKKTSQLFSVCAIFAISEEGKGSRFAFRLPKGILKFMFTFLIATFSYALSAYSANHRIPNDHYSITNSNLIKAGVYADSAYYSNINGTYSKTLLFADTARFYLNKYYLSKYPRGKKLMTRMEKSIQPAEISWYIDGLRTSYSVILDIRNESAVAALALHKWNVYRYNNSVYTQLYNIRSSDNTLGNYVRVMQISQTNKNVAVVILVLLLLSVFPAYYVLYYRRVLTYRFNLDRVKAVNAILLSEESGKDKLSEIQKLWKNQSLSDRRRASDRLNQLVLQIEDALKGSIDAEEKSKIDIELAEDECRHVQYDDDRLHISNSILDNCLSSLKHETMYYPSRIKQLVDSEEHNLNDIRDLMDYYKDLYSILSAQAMKEISTVEVHCSRIKWYGVEVIADEEMMRYLLEILHKLSGRHKLDVNASLQENKAYVVYSIVLPDMNLTQEQCEQLFSPSTVNVQFLICRQIIREIGEATNARGCGIQARKDNKNVIIDITIIRSKGNGKF